MLSTTTIRTPPWRFWRWLHHNLFSSRANALLTILTCVAGGVGLFVVIRFVFFDADWTVVEVNRRLFFLGRYPAGEEWRIWPPLWAAFGLAGFSFGAWSRLSIRDAIWQSAAVIFILTLLAHGSNGALFAGAVALAAVSYAAGRWSGRSPRGRAYARSAAVLGWLMLMPFTLLMIAAFGGVQPSLWGGLMLNVLLAAVGLGFGLPIGIGLALARASSLRAVKVVATAIIEVTRGGPLLAWLFIARFVLPEFVPSALNTDPIVNAMIIICLFTGAYIAEIVRGGLQSVPHHQVEAAQALGMGGVSVTLFIVLPQALRAVIPALVSQMISLWKDTTLFSILSFTDALGGAQAAVAQAEFIGRQKEVLLFTALAFWSIAFGMSRLAARLEGTLGVGVR